jgi:hypothetical protein
MLLVKPRLVAAQVENLVGHDRFSRSYVKCRLGTNPISVDFAQSKRISSGSAKDVKCFIIDQPPEEILAKTTSSRRLRKQYEMYWFCGVLV